MIQIDFYDGPESDTPIGYAELPIPPRLGEVVRIIKGDGYPKMGKVASVEWRIGHEQLWRVMIILDVM